MKEEKKQQELQEKLDHTLEAVNVKKQMLNDAMHAVGVSDVRP